jgi:glycosyltransferase involved in cell wall biosynthesis
MKNLSPFGVGCPTIVTINDLSHVILSDLYPKIDGLYWRLVQPQLLRRAKRIIAISESTKHDLTRFYGLDSEKLVTIYPSCDDRFRLPPKARELERVRATYGLPRSVLLYAGGLGVHKNVITLVQAFSRIANRIPHGLVLVGGAHHTTSDQSLADEVTALGLAGRVWMLGSVPSEDLPPLYHLADLFILASLNEGFGLVVLEAMACGTPVLAASRGGVAEVIGNCGRLLDDPLDVESLAEAAVALLADQRTLARMSADGLERSQAFTWKRTAELTLALYQEVTGGRR